MVAGKITVSPLKKRRGGEETTAKSPLGRGWARWQGYAEEQDSSMNVAAMHTRFRSRCKIQAGGSGQVFKATYKNNAEH